MILEEDEALLLRANEAFTDQSESKAIERRAGDKWMVYGSLDFIPPIEVEVNFHMKRPKKKTRITENIPWM